MQNFESHAVEASLVDSDDLRRLDHEVEEELASAVEAAEAAPFPELSEILTDVYVEDGR